MTGTIDPEHDQLLDQLFGRYAWVLDNHEFEQWPKLFTDECFYAAYSMENVERGLPLAYMLDDCRERLHDRVKYITKVWVGTVQPYRARHAIQRVSASIKGDGVYEVRANFLVGYTDVDQSPGVLAIGYYHDVVRIEARRALFERKEVYIDNTPPRYLIYPL